MTSGKEEWDRDEEFSSSSPERLDLSLVSASIFHASARARGKSESYRERVNERGR